VTSHAEIVDSAISTLKVWVGRRAVEAERYGLRIAECVGGEMLKKVSQTLTQKHRYAVFLLEMIADL
jgi:hypothetical protein